MASRNIAITEDVYFMLEKRKMSDDSFTKVISRLLADSERPSTYFGAWEGLTSDEEAKIIKAKKELRELWSSRNLA